MNWDNLRFFQAVVEQTSIAGAARQLAVNHSTVIRRLDQLEQELQVKLFHRLTSGYQLTDSGQHIYQQTLRLADNIRDLQQVGQQQADTIAGPLRISAADNDMLDISDACASFLQHHPQIEMTLLFDSHMADLNRLDADVAIRLTNQPGELLVGQKIADIHYRPYLNKTVSQTLPTNKNLTFSDVNWISWAQDQHDQSHTQWLQQQASGIVICATTNSEHAALKLVKAGIGAAYLPDTFAAQTTDLHCLESLPQPLTLGLWVLTHRDLRQVKRVQAFIAHLVANLRPTV